jgi:hypothetical protein
MAVSGRWRNSAMTECGKPAGLAIMPQEPHLYIHHKRKTFWFHFSK